MKRTLLQATETKKFSSPKKDITSFFKKVKVETNELKTSTVSAKVEKEVEPKKHESIVTSDIKSNKALHASFDKQEWVNSLKEEHRLLLDLEINTLHESWLLILYKELTKPYFLRLKEFVLQEQKINKIFPPPQDIYSWSRLTPLDKAKVLIIGQDPYHNDNQAHGLAFSVKDPNVKIPPSLQNIYKTIAVDYPEFSIPRRNANLTPWATDGVLMLNTCLTVKAHNANSHSNKGWEIFTKEVVNSLIHYKKANGEKLCIMCWGGPAQKLLTEIGKQNKDVTGNSSIYVLKSCHPSPLSAYRGDFFNCKHFKSCNEWLGDTEAIQWTNIKDVV